MVIRKTESWRKCVSESKEKKTPIEFNWKFSENTDTPTIDDVTSQEIDDQVDLLFFVEMIWLFLFFSSKGKISE